MKFWEFLVSFASGIVVAAAGVLIACHVSEAAKEVIAKCLGM